MARFKSMATLRGILSSVFVMHYGCASASRCGWCWQRRVTVLFLPTSLCQALMPAEIS
ncbi:hypothetical protein OH492_09500 [Vibrio chagasii]|nr:hypothetical protein [Vibrio chagasii]